MTDMRSGLPVLDFADQASFERWLAEQPADAPGLWLKLAKRGAGQPSLSKTEAVDSALCHGWIDGQMQAHDDSHWLTRFTPRKARSRWSELNRTRALQLIEEGRMRPAGLAQIKAARADGRWDTAYAPASTAAVPADLKAALDLNPRAAAFFAGLTGANRYAILYRIGAVKTPEARARRIAGFVEMLNEGRTVHDARRPGKPDAG